MTTEEWIAYGSLLVAAIALWRSVRAESGAAKAIDLAKRANEIAERANVIAEEANSQSASTSKLETRRRIVEGAVEAWKKRGNAIAYLQGEWDHLQKYQEWSLSDFEEIYSEASMKVKGAPPKELLKTQFDRAAQSPASHVVRTAWDPNQ